jgi:hypothetical protein
MGHPDRKRGPDNTIAMADKTKKFSKFRRLKTSIICTVYGTHKDTTLQKIAEFSLIGT